MTISKIIAIGVNYFIAKSIGVGVDANMPSNRGNLVDEVLGDVLLRLPLGNSGLAPYLFGGGGRTTDTSWEWVGQPGVGRQFRFSRRRVWVWRWDWRCRQAW